MCIRDRLKLGFYAPQTKYVWDIDSCPQLTQGLGEVFSFLKKEPGAFVSEHGHVQMLEGDDGNVLLSLDGEIKKEAIEEWKGHS